MRLLSRNNNLEKINVRKLLFLAFGSLSIFSIIARSGGTVHICPGSGISCEVTTGEGDQVRSEKDKDKGSIIVVFN